MGEKREDIEVRGKETRWEREERRVDGDKMREEKEGLDLRMETVVRAGMRKELVMEVVERKKLGK